MSKWRWDGHEAGVLMSEAEIVGLETIAARYVDAFRLLKMEPIRAFWWTKRKKT